MKRVLFIDCTCPKPYDPGILASEGLGGTEATVIRIAEALAQHAHVTVAQHNLAMPTVRMDMRPWYTPYTPELLNERWHAVVLLRDPRGLAEIRAKQKDTQLYLWMHDLAGNWVIQNADTIVSTRTTPVVVSDFHKTQTQEMLRIALPIDRMPRVVRLYNPIDDALKPDGTPVDPNKLVFFSAPHKGLKYALEMFERALDFNPNFKFYIANPGYFFDTSVQISSSCTNLGALPHAEILKHVREALCVFYPNWVFPETFGLVLAEANAVGTPVLTHPHGAAREVLNGQGQLVDCRNRVALLDRLMSWRDQGRPSVQARPEFRTAHVVKEWLRLLRL